jgi:hypothetical protein
MHNKEYLHYKIIKCLEELRSLQIRGIDVSDTIRSIELRVSLLNYKKK